MRRGTFYRKDCKNEVPDAAHPQGHIPQHGGIAKNRGHEEDKDVKEKVGEDGKAEE